MVQGFIYLMHSGRLQKNYIKLGKTSNPINTLTSRYRTYYGQNLRGGYVPSDDIDNDENLMKIALLPYYDSCEIYKIGIDDAKNLLKQTLNKQVCHRINY
jgi:hypothetical protein